MYIIPIVRPWRIFDNTDMYHTTRCPSHIPPNLNFLLQSFVSNCIYTSSILAHMLLNPLMFLSIPWPNTSSILFPNLGFRPKSYLRILMKVIILSTWYLWNTEIWHKLLLHHIKNKFSTSGTAWSWDWTLLMGLLAFYAWRI